MKPLLLRLILFAVLLTVALTSNAQYRKLIRGERIPFDTAVAIDINTYRAEGLYIKKSRILIDSLNVEAKDLTREVDSLYSELAVTNALYNTELSRTIILSESYTNISQDYHTLSGLFDQLANKQDPFLIRLFRWEGNWLVKTGKIIAGSIIIGLAGHGAVEMISR